MVEIEQRRPWNAARMLLLIGPGGAGKSSLGLELAPLLDRRLVDLDQEFCRRLGDITAFVRHEGYHRYKIENSALAAKIAAEAVCPTLLVASSGFLTTDNPEPALKANRSLLEASYSLCLLPSREREWAVRIIVERQLTRPFARDKEREEAVIRDRYGVYVGLGDLAVFSAASSRHIAKAIERHFSLQACSPPQR